MAQYWIESKDGSIHYNYDNYQSIERDISLKYIKIDTIEYIVAEGNNIDFSIFNLKFYTSIKCKIVNSSIGECKLKSKGIINRGGYFSHYVFENCNIDGLYIEATDIFAISIINCNINYVELFKCQNINQFNIIKKKKDIDDEKEENNIYKIDKLKLTDSNFKYFKLNNITIDTSDFLETKFEILLCQKCKISEFRSRDSEIEEFQFIENSIKSLILTATQIKNRLILDNIYYELMLPRIRIQDCDLNIEAIQIKNCAIKIMFQNIGFIKLRSVYITKSSGSRIIFSACHFLDNLSFVGNTLGVNLKIRIEDTTFISIVRFNALFEEVLQISNTIFQKNAIIPIRYIFFKYNIYNIVRTKFCKLIIFLFNKKYLELTKTYCLSPKKIHSSVWCILKNQALAKNDNINALKYRKYEMTSYLNETWKSKTNFGEIALLFFNWASNNHGYSWLRGLLFTISVWLIFFSLFAMSVDNFSFIHASKYHFMLLDRSFWTDAFDFLWLPQGLKSLTEKLNIKDLYKVSYIIMALSFILGKILIAYGIFQTVSAFRKHGKQN